MTTILGEIHGVRENVLVLKKQTDLALKQNQPLAIGFEWPTYCEKEINRYIQGEHNKLNWQSWEFIAYGDGRISKEHLEFLDWVRTKNNTRPRISVLCFDATNRSWNARDKAMAKKIQTFQTKNPGTHILAIMGRLHAQRTPWQDGKVKQLPLAHHLPKNATKTIELVYLTGSYFNENRKKIPARNRPIEPSSGFDEVIVIKEAHPTGKLKSSRNA